MTAGHFTARSGSVLYFDESGSGPPVLCLHGIGGGAYFLGGFARRLSARNRVLSVDLPGTGRSSSAMRPFTIDSIVSDLGDFVRDEIGEPVVLLGHSFGTMIALKAWEAWPASVRAMIFACGLPKVRPNVHERLSLRAADISKNGILGWGEKVSPGVFSKRTLRERPEMAVMFERLFEEQEPASYVRSIEVLLAADLGAIVPTVRVPCAAILGSEDSYAPPEAARAFTAQLPGPCRETVLDCGHMPFYEEPEAFADAVESFLDAL